MLYSYGRNFSVYSTVALKFQTELADEFKEPIEFHEVALQEQQFAASDADEVTVQYLLSLYRGQLPDLVVACGGLATRFALRRRDEIFPSAPLLLTAVEARVLNPFNLDTNSTAVPCRFDFPLVMEDMFRALPRTTNVVVVVGNSPMEQFWRQQLEQELAGYTNRVRLTMLSQYSLEEMRERVRHLPPHTVIFYFTLFVDAAGVPHEYDEAIKVLHKEANAPMIGVFGSELGLGIIGGPLLDLQDLGHDAAQVGLRLLKGESADGIHTPSARAESPIYDWRELQRWNISEANLPEGSIVNYREPSAWDRHKRLIVFGLSLLVVQSVLIGGLVANLSRRRKAERSLRESEERFRMMADSAPVLVWMADPDKLCIFFNRGWLEFTGRAMHQEVGHGWAKGVHPEDLEQCLKVYNACFDGREPFEVEYRLRRHDGVYRWVLDRGVPRYAPKGEFLGYVGVAIDLTDRKRAQEARQNLIHASRLAVVGEFTAMIVHELNQPLGAMLFNLDAMKGMLDPQTGRDREILEVLADVRAENMRAGEAMRRIRSLVSRHESKMEPMDINAAVREAIRLVEADVRRRSVQLHTDIQALPAMVRGDIVHLQQVMLNLIANGMDAMKDSAPSDRHLYVRTAGGVDGYVEVEVRDTGHGIQPEILSRIFESFFTTKPDGMGMGLSLVRSIVKMHSGRLWVENNKDGKGAAFRFILPVVAPQALKPKGQEEGSGRATETTV
jgi:PAS domain S-box-containing protein